MDEPPWPRVTPSSTVPETCPYYYYVVQRLSRYTFRASLATSAQRLIVNRGIVPSYST